MKTNFALLFLFLISFFSACSEEDTSIVPDQLEPTQ